MLLSFRDQPEKGPKGPPRRFAETPGPQQHLNLGTSQGVKEANASPTRAGTKVLRLVRTGSSQ